MGACLGRKPPKSPAKRQAFEEMRAQRQQQQHAAKRKRATPKAKMTKARSRYAQHLSEAIKQFWADHPHPSTGAAMAYASQSYKNKLQQQGLDTKRSKLQENRLARIAAKKAKEALQQAEAEQRQQHAEEVKQDRMAKMAEGLRRKQEEAKAQAK